VLSSLDVITQARVLQLLIRLQTTHRLTLVFISHDIGVTAAIASRILVFKDGLIREQGDTAEVLWNPSDEYTQQLISSALVRVEEEAQVAIQGLRTVDT
jgi:ABC-type dipeptide/oligopeptide/nickel transport system ATPase component